MSCLFRDFKNSFDKKFQKVKVFWKKRLSKSLSLSVSPSTSFSTILFPVHPSSQLFLPLSSLPSGQQCRPIDCGLLSRPFPVTDFTRKQAAVDCLLPKPSDQVLSMISRPLLCAHVPLDTCVACTKAVDQVNSSRRRRVASSHSPVVGE